MLPYDELSNLCPDIGNGFGDGAKVGTRLKKFLIFHAVEYVAAKCRNADDADWFASTSELAFICVALLRLSDFCYKSAASVMHPATAEAATVAGEPR